MAYREIFTVGDPVLRKNCRKVEKFDERLGTLLDDMAQTMNQADGVGLAAPQVGILRRVVVIDAGEGLVELVNPEILDKEGSQEDMEGCLSVPGQFGIVERAQRVKVRAQDRKGEPFEMEASDLFARAVQHELDHLDGVLFIDRAARMLTPEELDKYQQDEQ